MSVVAAGIPVLTFTIGLLCDKLRDYAAKQLKDGEFTDEKCRQIIVRELDDIKTQLKGLSRQYLLASISFFKEGVIRLYSSLDTSPDSYREEANTSKCDGATAAATKSQHDALERASELSKAIGNLKMTSQERYKSAKKSYEESRKLATVAFNNEALSTEDRLLASKLRIASRILKCLDDPEAAVRDCLLYLEELQNLTSIQDVFTLWRNAEKDITDQLRARFNKKKRSAAIESVRMMNSLLIQFAMKCTNITMGIYDWPAIEIAKMIYHPVCDDRTILKIIPRVYDLGPWTWRFDKPILSPNMCALTSKGEVLSFTRDGLEITRKEERVLFCTINTEIPLKQEVRCALDVDENDNVYIVQRFVSVTETRVQYKLLTLDANGDVKAHRCLEIIDVPLENAQVSVIQDGKVIIYDEHDNTAYICHSTSAEEDYKFALPIPTEAFDSLSLTVSNKNEIIAVLGKMWRKVVMYIITLHDTTLKHEKEIPIQFQFDTLNVLNVIFNRANQNILVYHMYIEEGSDDPFNLFVKSVRRSRRRAIGTLYTFSNTGELLHVFLIPWEGRERSLKSHPNGQITFVNADGLIMFKK